MWFIVLALLILLPFIYLLFAPFFIEIDSRSGLYRVRFLGLASAGLVPKQGSIFINVRILWWQREFDLLAAKPKTRKQPATKARKKKSKKGSPFLISWRQFRALVLSFRVGKCRIMIDTGDMPLNAILYPWSFMLSAQTGRILLINFHGENAVTLEIRNSLARMLWAFAKAHRE